MTLRSVKFSNNKFLVEANSELENNFWDLYDSEKWEYPYLKFMMENCNGEIFLDIGSWIGPVSLLMANYYDKVIAIDLDPVANERLKKNLVINNIKNVDLYELGFSNKHGRVKISSGKLGASTTSLYETITDKAIEVELVRLDYFLEKFADAKKVGFIKIDCEGAEYKILPQVYKFLIKRKIKVLISYHPFVLKKPAYYLIKIFHWLMQIRFKRYYFTNDGNVIIKNPYKPLFKLAGNLPMADVLEG